MTRLYAYLIAAVLSIAAWTGSMWWAYLHGIETQQSAEYRRANELWAERWTLQGQLATRDAQLAQAQQAAKNVRTETVIKREVIYRDRIKTPAVRDCVANSGLLQLYDATLGLSDTAE